MPINDRNFFTTMGGIPEDKEISSRIPKGTRSSILGNIVRRKQVSLDLLSPESAMFFGIPEEEETDEVDVLPNMFFPLRFAPRSKSGGGGGGGGGHGGGGHGGDLESIAKSAVAPPITRATRKDKIMALILAALLTAFVGVCVGWKTHEDEGHSLFGIVGTACVTNCTGDKDTRNFFVGHGDHFQKGDVSDSFAH